MLTGRLQGLSLMYAHVFYTFGSPLPEKQKKTFILQTSVECRHCRAAVNSYYIKYSILKLRACFS